MGFYKGITASYVGISETVIHFVIYEALKSKIVCYCNEMCAFLEQVEYFYNWMHIVFFISI